MQHQPKPQRGRQRPRWRPQLVMRRHTATHGNRHWEMVPTEAMRPHIAAAPGAGDSTVRPVVDANVAASRPFTAATPGVAGAPPDPGDAAVPAHAESAQAGDAAAPGAPPAAAAVVASAAAVVAAEVPNIYSAVVVKRDGRRDYAALALRSLALDSSRVCPAGCILTARLTNEHVDR